MIKQAIILIMMVMMSDATIIYYMDSGKVDQIDTPKELQRGHELIADINFKILGMGMVITLIIGVIIGSVLLLTLKGFVESKNEKIAF